MPPKASSSSAGAKGSGVPSKKTEQKKKEKVVEDKTFGIKNKKGAKQQKFIQQVQKQVHFGGNPSSRKLEAARLEEREKKKLGQTPDEVEKDLFKPVQQVAKGSDPKSILCAFFKQGTCGKGDKCKFSHDLTIERKAEKRSLYCDMRADGETGGDTMENWDEDKLKEVVEKRHNTENSSAGKTEIVCKFFLEAVNLSKYGWFWECPNGSNCHYRHALPPGFVLKKDVVKEKKDDFDLEGWIETQRNQLFSDGKELTRVTIETFTAWKKRKIEEKKELKKQEDQKKLRNFKQNKMLGISGRLMFTFNPALVEDEDDEDGNVYEMNYGSSSEDEGEEKVEFKQVEYGNEDYLNMEDLNINEDLFVDDDDDGDDDEIDD